MKLIGWKIFYDDGSVVNSEESEWGDCPNDGIVCVVKYFNRSSPDGNPYRELLQNQDFYFRVETCDGIIIGANCDSVESIEVRYPGADVKRGKWTNDETYEDVIDNAMNEREL